MPKLFFGSEINNIKVSLLYSLVKITGILKLVETLVLFIVFDSYILTKSKLKLNVLYLSLSLSLMFIWRHEAILHSDWPRAVKFSFKTTSEDS